jgi:hypothetical protein
MHRRRIVSEIAIVELMDKSMNGMNLEGNLTGLRIDGTHDP